MVDPLELARDMQRLRPWLDAVSGSDCDYRRLEGAPFGSALVAIDRATRGGRNPSTNRNAIHLCGVGAGLDEPGLAALLAIFADEGIGRFFIHLAPGPGMDRARDLIRAAGFERHLWVRYPVLALVGTAKPPAPGGIVAREVGRDEALAAREAMSATMRSRFAASPRGPGVRHLLAFDGDRPIAHAALAHHERLACIGWLSIRAPARRGAAEQALIAAAVAMARTLGTERIVAETLAVLGAARAGFMRAGFHEVYERETYRLAGAGTLGGVDMPR